MEYRVYLLDISRWLQKVNRENVGLMLEDASARYALTLISKERAEKVLRARTPIGQAHSLGAGLLLQYVWQQGWEGTACEAPEPHLHPISVGQVIEHLQGAQPEAIPMTYGPKGKPYFADRRLYFSLSHSGDYVLCAVSEKEIGADIQQCKPGIKESLVRRVLSDTELKQWQVSQQEEAFFYRKWTEKEAYGKLTGEGVFELLEKKKEPLVVICAESFREVPGYCISICQYRK